MARGQSPFQGQYTVPIADFSGIERGGAAWGEAFKGIGEQVEKYGLRKQEQEVELGEIKSTLEFVKSQKSKEQDPSMLVYYDNLENQLEDQNVSSKQRAALASGMMKKLTLSSQLDTAKLTQEQMNLNNELLDRTQDDKVKLQRSEALISDLMAQDTPAGIIRVKEKHRADTRKSRQAFKHEEEMHPIEKEVLQKGIKKTEAETAEIVSDIGGGKTGTFTPIKYAVTDEVGNTVMTPDPNYGYVKGKGNTLFQRTKDSDGNWKFNTIATGVDEATALSKLKTWHKEAQEETGNQFAFTKTNDKEWYEFFADDKEINFTVELLDAVLERGVVQEDGTITFEWQGEDGEDYKVTKIKTLEAMKNAPKGSRDRKRAELIKLYRHHRNERIRLPSASRPGTGGTGGITDEDVEDAIDKIDL